MRRLYLRDCTPGDVIEDVYVITNKQLSATSTGKYFIKAFLSDRTGQVTARMWNATRDLFNAIPESGFLRIRGRVENYQNNLQFIIEQIWPAKDGGFDVTDLLPHTACDIDEMCQRLFAICGSIRNKYLAALLQAYLDDEDLMNNFCKAPAAMNFHHAFIGGLLEHTLNAMEVADAVCKFYPALNRDIVVSGIFLHDLAKTWELRYDSAFSYTDAGQLVGHIVKGAIWVETKALAAERALGEPIPRTLIDVMQHIILSHHGEPEFGAARLPSTPEAIAVHVIENFDAKMMMALGATRGTNQPATDGNWTEYLKAFSGRLYRPDVAPNENGESVTEEDSRNEHPAAPFEAKPHANAAPDASTVARLTKNSEIAANPQPPARPATHPSGGREERPPAAPSPFDLAKQRQNQLNEKSRNGPPPPITNPLFETVPARKK